jgi:putative DNA primase/helicase
MGSLAFVAAARASYVVIKDQDNPSRRLMLPVKNNLAKEGSGLAYSVVAAENGEPVVAWESEPVTTTATEALAPAESSDERTDTDWAVAILQDVLADGPKPAAEINKEARSAGIREKALRRAQKKLEVKHIKSGFHGGWVWALPGREHVQGAQEALLQDKGAFAAEGRLRSEQVTSEQ